LNKVEMSYQGDDMCTGCALRRGTGGADRGASLGERTADGEDDEEGHGDGEGEGEDSSHAVEENISIWVSRWHEGGERMNETNLIIVVSMMPG